MGECILKTRKVDLVYSIVMRVLFEFHNKSLHIPTIKYDFGRRRYSWPINYMVILYYIIKYIEIVICTKHLFF